MGEYRILTYSSLFNHGTLSLCQLFVALCISRWDHEDESRKRFHMTYVPWETFLQTMLAMDPNSEVLKGLMKADLVIGGIDMSISYLYEPIITLG